MGGVGVVEADSLTPAGSAPQSRTSTTLRSIANPPRLRLSLPAMTTLTQRLQVLKRKLKLRPNPPRNDVIHLGGRDNLAPLGVLTEGVSAERLSRKHVAPQFSPARCLVEAVGAAAGLRSLRSHALEECWSVLGHVPAVRAAVSFANCLFPRSRACSSSTPRA